MLSFFRREKSAPEEGGTLVEAPDQQGMPKGFRRMRWQRPDGSMTRRSIGIPNRELSDFIMHVKARTEDENLMHSLVKAENEVKEKESELRARGYERVGRIMNGNGEGI